MANLARHIFAALTSLLFVFMWLAAGNPDPFGPWFAAFAQGAPCGPNPVACENRKTGDADFEISGDGGSTIQGFATDISVNIGQRVNFKISAPGAASYAIDIYRLGYYGGAGARKLATIAPSALTEQPDCLTDSATGLVDCGNWTVSASWIVPFDAVSGVYIAKPTRPDNGEASHIYFVVRDDTRTADILVQTADTTWQAYNRYGGASLYCADANGVSNAGSAYANSCGRRATKVSYNRPFDTRAHSPQSFLFSAEYPMLRFLEANGFDIKYWAGVDTDRRGADLTGATKPKVFLSSGHDEYWSGQQRARVEAARGAGVNLAFFSGNEIYWKTRYESSTASTDEATSNPAYRTLVSYKDTLAGVKLDPMLNVATGTWRDTRFAPPVADGGRPENALIGSIWTVNSGTSAIEVPPSMANLRLWRNTRIATQGGGTLAPSSLGYEWGEDLDNGARPAGVIHLSATRVNGVEKIVDFGSTVATGTATHNLTLYRHQSGALVFGASTVQWAWGLDGAHDDHGQSLPSHTPDLAMQQATVNLLADMGAQAASLQANLVGSTGSTDALPPTTTIGSPAVGASVGSGDRVLIAGTASDNGGGAVAGVEVSVDGGTTWRPAQGTTAWTFEWSAGAVGSASIRARAIDDSGNQEIPGASLAVSVVAGRCPCPSIWSASTVPAVPDVDDSSPVELGLKFRSDVDGFIKGVRFYKGIGNSGTHVGNLWTAAGSLLARASFGVETATGWQQVLFDEPVEIAANTTYVVSYHTNVGHYAASAGYFSTLGADAPPLHALSSGAAGGNGVYKYGATDFPNETFSATNYFVDVVFDSTTDTTGPAIADVAATAVDSSTAVVSWTTNEPATSNVDYSTDSTFPVALTLHASNPALTLAHTMRITGLRANTRYSFRLRSTDRIGNEGTWPPAGPPQPGPGGTPVPREFTTPKPTLHDTTTADFSAGLPTSVHIAESGDGELVLSPSTGVEFAGTALPAGWSSSIWSPGGTVVVDGGRLTVDGARVLRDQTETGPGRSLEFVATFTGDPFQHSGLGQTLASSFEPLALFSTSWVDVDGTPRAGGSLAVRTSIGDGSEMSTNLGPEYFNAPHRYRIDWQAAAVTYFVDGVQVASHPIAISTQMRPVAASDFNAFSGTIAVDWIRLSPYAPAGSFLSRVFDAGAVVDWHEIEWTADTPEGTSLAISARSGMTPLPDGTWTEFMPVAAPGPLGLRSRYVQYRAALATTVADRTPELRDIVISSTQPSLTAANDHVIVAENGHHLFPASGAGSLTANDADSDPGAPLRVVSVTAPAHGTAVLGADGSVTYTPATNYHGADAFGYTAGDGVLTADATVTIDVTGNIAPVAKDDSYAVDEDGAINVPAASGLLVNDGDAEHDPLTARLVSPPTHGVLTLSGDGSFSYSPAENYTGTDAFTYTANDGFDDSLDVATVRISVAPVNDRPFFTKGADQVALEDAGPQTLVGWATGISAGAPAESAQVLNFIVATTNTTMFAAGPSISPDGTLSYTPAPNANGSAVVTVRLHDNGGSPGVDTSDPQTFGIVVTAVNDAPSFVKGADQTVLEDAGAQTAAGWATAVSAGAADESAQALNFIVSNDNASLFLVQPAISAGGTLTYTPISNRSGSATVTVRLHDNGGAVGGADTSPAQTFIITVSSVNDPPSFTKGADQSVLEDASAQSVAGWATALSAGAPDETGQTLDFIVTSNNGALFAVPPAISANGTLTYKPAADANGTATVTVRLHDNGGIAPGVDTSAPQTFTIAVAAVNDAPSFTKGADQSVGEDAGLQSVASWATLISVGPANESGQVGTFSITGNTNPSLFATGPVVDASGKLTYTPAANANGSATMTLRLTDSGGVANTGVDASPAQTFVISVAARNDTPSFVKGANQSVLEDAGPQSVSGWATGLNAGAPDEAGQALDFIVTNSNSALFSAQPAITAGGTLSYTPALNANGSATVTVRLHDNGGISGGGADTSAPQTFTIAIAAVNDAPSFTKGADQSIGEDAGLQSVASWATLISVGPADESAQLATFNIISTTNPSLFATSPAVDASGKLTYTPAANASGTATITLRLTDNGGVANNGVDASPAQTFVITVAARNDAPSFTKGADQTVLEDAGPRTVAGWATGLNAGAADEGAQLLDFIVSTNNDALFSVRPTIASNGTLTYTSAANANGTATVTVRLHDNGGVTGGGGDTSAPQTFTITVTPVNDAPSFTNGADQAIAEDGGPQSVASWATGISMGPADESGQLATFNITSNTNPSLFATGPAVGANGTLTYTPAANASGSATITLRLTDNGGVANNGVDVSPTQSFVITVAGRNDAPSFTKGADQTVPEDAGAQSLAWATNINAGAGDEAAQALDFLVATSNTPLFSAQPAITAGGTLSYTPAPNANGSATVTVRLHDNGGTAGGGTDTSAAQTFTITITPVNDAPVAVSDNAATTIGLAVTIPVLANDTDVDSTTLSIVSLSATTGVTVTANTDGTVRYTPAADFLGSDTFTYRAKDAVGGISEPATVSVIVGLKSVTQVASANQPVTTGATALPADPVQSSVTSPVNATVSVTTGVVSESAAPDGYTFLNQQVNISVAAANRADITADPANPIVLTFTVDASAIPAGETIQTIQILRNDVALAECPGATAIPAGQDPCIKARAILSGGDADGDFRFTVLTTHASRWNFALRRVVVNPQAVNDRYTVAGGATLSVAAPGVLGNDFARNAMTAVLVSPPSGTFTLNPNGAFAFTPAAGACADVSFTYKATDKNGSSNVATATIAVQCAPVADDDAFETLEDVAVTGSVLVGDTADPNAGALQAIKVSGPAHGALTLNADGTFTYTPALNYNGVDSFTYKAIDGSLQSAAATVQLTMTPVNDAPIFTKGPNHTSASASVAQAVAAWATGISAGPNETGQTLTFVVTNDKPALFNVQPAVSPSGTLTYTPKPGDGGVANLTVLLKDDGGTTAGGVDASSAQAFTITIPAANTAPTVTATSSSASVSEGSQVTLSATGSDADPGEQLSFAWDLDGDGSYETPGSAVAFTPANGPATLTPRVKVTDRGGLTAVASVTIAVSNVPPVVSDTIVWNGDSTIIEPIAKARTPFTATVSFTDAGKGDTHTVTYAWGDGSTTATSNGVVTESDGAGTAIGTHTYTQPGFYTVTVTVTDGADTVTTTAKSVVVVDPAGKSLTGLGSFVSPVGSVVSKPTIGGSGAINALTAKYGPDGTLTYAGNTNAFRFTHATGGVSLTSTKMSWIVVNGNKAWLKGEGNATVAGVVQPATYLVAAVDATASPSVDKIRVRIVNKVSGQVIYDTQKNAADTADATTSTPIFSTLSLK